MRIRLDQVVDTFFTAASFLLPSAALLPFNSVLSVSVNSNLNGSLVCPGQHLWFICTINAPILAWSSNEYIGPPGTRIEFSIIDSNGRTKTEGSAEARLLGSNEVNVTLPELQLVASQDFPAGAVTCNDGTESRSIEFKVSGMFYYNLVMMVILLPRAHV